MHKNVENLYRMWTVASNMERADGLVYYQEQRRKLTTIAWNRNMSATVAIGAFAALSPNNDERGNYRDVITTIEAVQKGLGPNDFRVNSYNPNKVKAVRIVRGEAPLDVLRGPKVRSFYRNTFDPTDPEPVTVDGHLASAWIGRRVILKDMAHELKIEKYRAIVADIRYLAGTLGLIPCQLQSVIWITWKRVNKIRYNPQLPLWDLE